MLARSERSGAVIGEGATRLTLAITLLIFVSLYFLRQHAIIGDDVLRAMGKRSEAIFSSGFTFLSIFWAAMLTIWSLLKSRATRYIERLTDNAIFRGFLRDLELRLAFGFVVTIVSFGMYIVNPSFTGQPQFVALLVWGFLWLASVVLLFDSVFTARVVLD